MFKIKRAEEFPLPVWLTQQAVAAAPVQSERARLLKEESNDNEKKNHRRAKTCLIAITLLLTMMLLVALILLVAQALSTVISARDSVGAQVTTLMNHSQAIALDTRTAINSLRGASQNAELFTVHSFQHLENASAHIHDLSEFIERSAHYPLSMKLVG